MTVKSGSFLQPFGVGGGVQSVTGIGFQPAQVLLFSATRPDPQGLFSGIDVLFSVGTSTSRGFGFYEHVDTGFEEEAQGAAFAALDYFGFPTGATHNNLGHRLQLTTITFTADGFDITWSVGHASAQNVRIWYVAFNDRVILEVGSTSISVSGNGPVTAVCGFEPNLIMAAIPIVSSSGATFPGLVNFEAHSFSLGFASGPGSQFCYSGINGASADAGFSMQRVRLTKVSNSLVVSGRGYPSYFGGPTTIGIDIDVSLDAFTPTGFDATVSNFVNYSFFGTPSFGFIAFRTSGAEVGSFLLNQTSGVQTITTTNKPTFIFFMNGGEDATTPVTDESRLGLGYMAEDLGSAASFYAINNSPAYPSPPSTCETRLEGDVALLVGTTPDFSATPGTITKTSFSLDITTASLSYQPLIGYLALTLPPSGKFLRIKNTVMPPKATHYMTVPHDTAGLAKSAWTIALYKNGERVTDIPVDMVENPPQFYQFSFQNDGTHESMWNLAVYPTADTSQRYAESWIVNKRIVESNVKYLRSKADSESGFFKSNVNKED